MFFFSFLVPCSSVRDCAVNEKCIDNRCHVQCLRDRDCYSGEICEQNFCRGIQPFFINLFNFLDLIEIF